MAREEGPARLAGIRTTLAGEGVRLALLSLLSLGLGYLLTAALSSGFGLNPRGAYGIALVVCSIGNFFGCRHFVFPGEKGPLWLEAAKFFPSVLAFRAVEVVLFSALMALHPNYHVAYFATASLAMAGKLLVSRYFIFRRKRDC